MRKTTTKESDRYTYQVPGVEIIHGFYMRNWYEAIGFAKGRLVHCRKGKTRPITVKAACERMARIWPIANFLELDFMKEGQFSQGRFYGLIAKSLR